MPRLSIFDTENDGLGNMAAPGGYYRSPDSYIPGHPDWDAWLNAEWNSGGWSAEYGGGGSFDVGGGYSGMPPYDPANYDFPVQTTAPVTSTGGGAQLPPAGGPPAVAPVGSSGDPIGVSAAGGSDGQLFGFDKSTLLLVGLGLGLLLVVGNND